MKDHTRQYITVVLEVPVDDVDFRECHDYGDDLTMARLKASYSDRPILCFEDPKEARVFLSCDLAKRENLARRSLRKLDRIAQYLGDRKEKNLALNHYTKLARDAQEMRDEMERRKRA